MTTKGEWVAYTGSDEQIAELHSPPNDVLLKGKSGKQYFKGARFLNHEDDDLTHYLICNPHPLADMICQWARTGQPVWIRWHIQADKWDEDIDGYDELYETTTPDWNIPNAEYSFTAFKE